VDAAAAMPLDAGHAAGEISMIVNFSTRFDRLTMFGEPALTLLSMLGHSARLPGAILAADLPGALARLRAALEQSGHVPSPAPAAPEPAEADDRRPVDRPVNLATRAVPLIAMIERAIAGGSDLMWDRG
jgi:hypothetical protein